MTRNISRRKFVSTSAALGVAVAAPATLKGSNGGADPEGLFKAGSAPAVLRPKVANPVVVSDSSGFRFKNGGPENSVERAYRGIVEGDDVLDALIAGVPHHLHPDVVVCSNVSDIGLVAADLQSVGPRVGDIEPVAELT